MFDTSCLTDKDLNKKCFIIKKGHFNCLTPLNQSSLSHLCFFLSPAYLHFKQETTRSLQQFGFDCFKGATVNGKSFVSRHILVTQDVPGRKFHLRRTAWPLTLLGKNKTKQTSKLAHEPPSFRLSAAPPSQASSRFRRLGGGGGRFYTTVVQWSCWQDGGEKTAQGYQQNRLLKFKNRLWKVGRRERKRWECRSARRLFSQSNTSNHKKSMCLVYFPGAEPPVPFDSFMLLVLLEALKSNLKCWVWNKLTKLILLHPLSPEQPIGKQTLLLPLGPPATLRAVGPIHRWAESLWHHTEVGLMVGALSSFMSVMCVAYGCVGGADGEQWLELVSEYSPTTQLATPSKQPWDWVFLPFQWSRQRETLRPVTI